MVKDKTTNGPPEYATMQLTDLRVSRRGKHHTLVSGILEQMERLADGSALIIPLNGIGKMSLAGLRSAVTRATTARNLPIKTYSDEKNFYVWKKAEEHSKQQRDAHRP